MKKAALFFSIVAMTTVSLFGFRAENESMQKEGKPATIKVLLSDDLDGSLVEVRGAYRVYDAKSSKKLSSGMKGKRYFVFPLKNGIKWGEEYPGVHQIRIIPQKANTTILVDGTQYRGAIEIYSIDDKLHIINEVDVETFLKCSLANRLPSTISSAVRDAVAIVARTDAYYRALSNYDSYWHVSAKESGYRSYSDAYSDFETTRSIENTRFLIMTYDAQPFATTWTENCAGKTASYQVIYRKNTASPEGVRSDFAAKDREDFQWHLSIKAEQLAQIFKTNRITEIDSFVDHKSQKVYGVRVKDGTHEKDLDFVSLQKALGEARLKSSDFTIAMKGNQIVFTGYGMGSGVGLCLYSATQMSEAGDLAPKILADFYPFTHLEKMRSYPDMIISPSKGYFISPKKRPSSKNKRVKHEPTYSF